ncbi:DUF58 domain-containing protein [Cellulomonas soli]|uniref:DUF58 domain-containing protein n=1 Tax=Cellulomonas soli TaxID=931535 RepID=A0A512PDA8_9CELL|nr:DUF58 domain-containing protein [Cellulomonas soli]NYI60156.1 uncharacterized protein (DUF58 family) [Cellulomonas soli]GEP69191.1 hypothetical protein CSO01_19060 [Cellulomonas soli]
MHVSATGWGVAVVAVLGLVLGRWLGWAEAASLGAALAAVLVVALLLTVGRTRYAVRLDLADRRVRIGERAVGGLTVRNTARGRSLPARVELPVGAGRAEFAVPSLAAGAEHDELFAIPTARRAVVVVGPVESVRGDALGLVRRTLRWTRPVELFVHPRVVPLHGASAGVLRDLEGQSTRDLSDADLSFHALRDYVQGDDRRAIHWRTTARRGTLMVKQFEDTRRTQTAVVLATDAADYADLEEFETAVSVAASLGVQTLREQRDLTVLAGPGRLRVNTPPLLLDDCSRIMLGSSAGSAGLGRGRDVPSATGTALLGRRVAREAPDATVAVLITGSVATDAALRLGARHVPTGTRTVVVSCVTGGELRVRTQSTLTLASLATVDDLPRVLRRVVA